MNNVEMTSGKLYIDGRETRILSGAIHYFRIRPEQWRDRILKAKQMAICLAFKIRSRHCSGRILK